MGGLQVEIAELCSCLKHCLKRQYQMNSTHINHKWALLSRPAS